MGTGVKALAVERGARGRFARLGAVVPYVEFLLALGAAGLFYSQGSFVWPSRGPIGAWPPKGSMMVWPFVLLGLSRLLALARVGFRLRVSPFGIPLWLFLASCGLGVWAAYDRGAAWVAFCLILSGVGIYYAVADQPDLGHLYTILAFWGAFGLALSLYFLATNDWTAQEAKVPALVALGQSIQKWLPKPADFQVNPNAAGGILAVIMPLYVPLIILGRRRAATGAHPLARLWPWFWGLAAGVAGLGWFLSMSRGAWAALVGATALWVAWHILGRWSRRMAPGRPERAWRVRLLAVAILVLVGAGLALAVLFGVVSGRLPGREALAGRLELFRDGLLLARDYRFTGLGLWALPLSFSIYTLLIHVSYIDHIHNMLLDILIAQGALGLLPYLGLLASALVFSFRQLRRLEGSPTGQAWIIEAGLVSLGAMLAHGMLDDIFYGYQGVVLHFVPLALILAASRVGEVPVWTERPARRWPAVVAGIVLLALLVCLGIANRQKLLGAWYANLGALAQARVELNAYDEWHFDNPTLDQVRQREDLSVAINWLNRALQADPANPTARQRLAAIALARGQYEQALEHMQAAWAAGHRDSVTRLLLGDALVAAGQPEQAAEIVRGLTWAVPRLLGQAWSRYWLGQDYRRAADAWATVLLLKPGDEGATYWREEAEKRLNVGTLKR